MAERTSGDTDSSGNSSRVEKLAGRAPLCVVETHVSLLVFLDGIVLKYKKPVKLPFLDFTDSERRLEACTSEVDSNRRLSPDVYLGVADVRLDDTQLDHAVVMRRLPDDRNLEQLVKRGRPIDDDLRRIAHVLASFHADAERSEAIDESASSEALARTLHESLRTLGGTLSSFVDLRLVDRVSRLADTYLEGRRALFADRVARGRICDGHGDLLASDIFILDDGPRILDCVEFDPRLRHVDVVADIAFLVMDLERLGARHAAQRFATMYREASGDVFPASLLHYYCAQRAIVRAVVSTLRADQMVTAGLGGSSRVRAREHERDALLGLALEHLLAGEVVLGVVSGLPGTGKSTLAATAAYELDWPLLRSDEIRKEVLDLARDESPTGQVESGRYSRSATGLTYRTMLDRARTALERGESVVLDATFTDGEFRSEAVELARSTSSRISVVECRAGRDAALGRVRRRREHGNDVSEASEEVTRWMFSRATPWPGAIVVDTTGRATQDCLGEVLAAFSQSPSRRVDSSDPTLDTSPSR